MKSSSFFTSCSSAVSFFSAAAVPVLVKTKTGAISVVKTMAIKPFSYIHRHYMAFDAFERKKLSNKIFLMSRGKHKNLARNRETMTIMMMTCMCA